MNICIFGASSDSIPREYLDAAGRFGTETARRGHTLYFGGGAHGVMGEAARGAASLGGTIVGVAPSFFNVGDTLFRDGAELILTETMRERKALLEDGADAFAVLPGGIGTYEEFFEVLVLCQLHQLHKPIAVYNVGGCYDKLRELIESTVTHGFMSSSCLDLCRFCKTEEEVFGYFSEYYNGNTQAGIYL